MKMEGGVKGAGCLGAGFLGSTSGSLGESRCCLGAHLHQSGFGVTLFSSAGSLLWSSSFFRTLLYTIHFCRGEKTDSLAGS